MRSFQFIMSLMVSFVLPAELIAQSRPAEALPPTVVRVYDVRDLIAPVQDFPLSTSPYAQAFLSPWGAPHSTMYSVGAQPTAGTLFPPQSKAETTEKAAQST